MIYVSVCFHLVMCILITCQSNVGIQWNLNENLMAGFPMSFMMYLQEVVEVGRGWGGGHV